MKAGIADHPGALAAALADAEGLSPPGSPHVRDGHSPIPSIRWLPAAFLAFFLHACLLFGWQWNKPVTLPLGGAKELGVEIDLEFAGPAPAPVRQQFAAQDAVPEHPAPSGVPAEAPAKASAMQAEKAGTQTGASRRHAPAGSAPGQATAAPSAAARSADDFQAQAPDLAASPLARPKPAYPAVARQRGQEGLVLVLAAVDEHGLPISVHVEKSSGYSLLDQAAVQAIRQWRFHPARQAGAPVRDQVLIPVEFRLNEGP